MNSARIGVAKPDQRVYRIAAELVSTPASRCLFIDDTGVNVAVAREAGMTAFHYRQFDDLHVALSPLLAQTLSEAEHL